MEQTIEAELAQARVARQQGNLGQVRVCARRAAAIAIRARYGWPGDALKRLRRLEAEPGTPAAVGAAAVRLTTKVDENHQLPFDNDPVEDARLIIAYLTPAFGSPSPDA